MNNLSLLHEKNIQYESKVDYLHVSSAERDPLRFPDVNNYTVYFDREFKNVKSIELIQSIIPATNSVANEPFLVLKINEVEHTMYSKNALIDGSFAILQMATPVNGWVQIRKDIHEIVVKNYITPLSSLTKFSIGIYKKDNTLFDFGTDTDPIDLDLQNHFVFKITTVEKSRQDINYRATFG